mmetsp:Transcript_19634/g.36319  ORF Transcript_19634/g.36319 Transcript_19634/m.36319 type:complete len:531 (-) Transcript_19634:110-1702(-)|eukprot:CAMPEP_0184519066 /NCGR_PEP_ID=MMETSP0198_2-20121128/6423_1 /TAXON_ID=1112570 /ORGANISM="Thraustochytrium sp., Strain LLF1b" /LENGTH=530 /DNA_ID=CAMNT_0026909547 /DNA_START=69 /DNA_END=1661 /DNA_ORIENTATION=+
MNVIKEARQKRLAEHREFIAGITETRGGEEVVSFNLCCFFGPTCVWVHDSSDDTDEPKAQDVEMESQKTMGELRLLSQITTDVNYHIDRDQLHVKKELGSGGNGTVYLASYSGSPVAVKMMSNEARFGNCDAPPISEDKSKSFHENEQERDALVNEEFIKEFNHLKRIRHPHVIDLYGATVDIAPDTLTCKRLLVMELAACSLRDVLRNPDAPAPMGTALVWTRQVLSGLAFLHSKGILHLDMKPANVLLDMSGTAKICDLGLARNTSHESQNSLTLTRSVRRGTPAYMGPELTAKNGTRISGKTDIYAVGVMLWEALHRQSPYPSSWSIFDILTKVAQGHRPNIEPDVPPGLSRLIRWAWHQDPSKRPDCSDIIDALDDLAPSTLPVLEAANGDSGGEPFLVWNAEALCFLSDCVWAGTNDNGFFHIKFLDGQPDQFQVDPRNIVLPRKLKAKKCTVLETNAGVNAGAPEPQPSSLRGEAHKSKIGKAKSGLVEVEMVGAPKGKESPNETSVNTPTNINGWLAEMNEYM